MAVLVEAISIVVQRARIDAVYPGGWPQFERDCPNGTLCTDGELARHGFLHPDDVAAESARLEEHGLVFFDGEQAVDFAVVDQQRGPTTRCDWLAFSRLAVDDSGGQVAFAAWHGASRFGFGVHLEMEGSRLAIATPPGWEYETSLSHRFGFVPTAGTEGPASAADDGASSSRVR